MPKDAPLNVGINYCSGCQITEPVVDPTGVQANFIGANYLQLPGCSGGICNLYAKTDFFVLPSLDPLTLSHATEPAGQPTTSGAYGLDISATKSIAGERRRLHGANIHPYTQVFLGKPDPWSEDPLDWDLYPTTVVDRADDYTWVDVDLPHLGSSAPSIHHRGAQSERRRLLPRRHCVTPYEVRHPSPDESEIWVYDNNHTNDPRVVTIDRLANTYDYSDTSEEKHGKSMVTYPRSIFNSSGAHFPLDVFGLLEMVIMGGDASNGDLTAAPGSFTSLDLPLLGAEDEQEVTAQMVQAGRAHGGRAGGSDLLPGFAQRRDADRSFLFGCKADAP